MNFRAVKSRKLSKMNYSSIMLNISDIANPTIKLRPMKSLRRTNYVLKAVSLNDRI